MEDNPEHLASQSVTLAQLRKFAALAGLKQPDCVIGEPRAYIINHPERVQIVRPEQASRAIRKQSE